MSKTATKKSVKINIQNEEPSKTTIMNILNYSKSVMIKKSKNLEFVEVVLN